MFKSFLKRMGRGISHLLHDIPVVSFLLKVILFVSGILIVFSFGMSILVAIGSAFGNDEVSGTLKVVQIIILTVPTIFLLWRGVMNLKSSNDKSKEIQNLRAKLREANEFEKISGAVEEVFNRVSQEKFATLGFSYLAGALAYILLFGNSLYDFVPGWYSVMSAGLIAAAIYFNVNLIDARSELIRSELETVDESEARSKFDNAKRELKKIISINLVILLAVNVNWAYRVNSDFSKDKEIAVNEVLGLVGEGWCANFADIDVYDGGETVVKSGGWPCIKIASVTNLQFDKEQDSPVLCVDIAFQIENGFPGEESFESPSDFTPICVPDNLYESWSADNFQDEIYDEYMISQALDELKTQLCSRYSFRMSEDINFIYC